MAHMMILSWSGTRLQQVINNENSSFFSKEREKTLTTLQSHGVIHGDIEWRNMLWDELTGRLVVIDLEEVKWLKRPRPLQSTSGNSGVHITRTRGKKQRRLSNPAAACI